MGCYHVDAKVIKWSKSVDAYEDIIRKKSRRYMIIYSFSSKNFGIAPNALNQAFPLTPAYTVFTMAEDVCVENRYQHQPSISIVNSVCWLARSLSNVVP
jgi:hypothetical protein